MFSNLKYFLTAFAVTVLCAACAEDRLAIDSPESSMRGPVIYATMADAAATKTTIKTEDLTSGAYSASILWVPSDEIGVYTTNRSNLRFFNTNRGTDVNVHKAMFYQDEPGQGKEESSSEYQNRLFDGTVTCAYYPHDISNNDKSSSALPGTVPVNPVIDLSTELIPRDYKWGELLESSNNVYKFKFHNLFSLAQFSIDASGTALEGDALETVEFSVTRNGNTVPVAGDFTFNASNGDYSLTDGDVSNSLTIRWKNAPILNKTLSAFVTVFPEVKVGDKLNFTITTKMHIATLSVTAKVDFESEMYYTFPLSLSKFSAGKVNVTERNITQGTFTCATYNVDGLPKKISFVTINDDGPGEDGTKNISAKIASQNWDFVGFSEDFEYHSQLKTSLGAYTFGTHRGSVSASALYKTLDTDGLEFATNNSTCSFSGESCTAFNNKSGGLTSGANTCIKKGVRYYLVTLKDGTEIDVVITHMNTSGDENKLNAQHGQLTEVANYINNLKKNKRPIIFMGDTNCRYTRHDFQTYFWDILDSAFEVHDPWVDFQWDGIYPTHGSKSLMVEDATGTDAKYDVIYDGYQKGEVVDKIIYINNSEAPVQISANSYNRDANFMGLADHLPIVAEFTYTKEN